MLQSLISKKKNSEYFPNYFYVTFKCYGTIYNALKKERPVWFTGCTVQDILFDMNDF